MATDGAEVNWFQVSNTDDIPSPALLIYRNRVEANLREMLRIAGHPARLRPHVKTHKLPDLNFVPAAVLLTRVVSKPGSERLCLDLGYKAVASEMPPPRAVFLGLPEATAVLHSEEHLVIATPQAERWRAGACLYCLPRHVCPTVALHHEVWVVEHGCAVERWTVAARARRLTL